MEAVKVLATQIDVRGEIAGFFEMAQSCTYTTPNKHWYASALCLPSPEHGTFIQMSQPLALSGLYPHILPF